MLQLIARWLSLLEDKENSPYPYAILCVLSVFSMTIKLSACFILVLTIKPAVMLIIEKKWKEIVFFILCGIIIRMPFMARNVMLCGFLFYPYASIDLFDFDWKMSSAERIADASAIQTWGRDMQFSDISNPTFLQWFPQWLSNKNIVLAGIVCFDMLMIPAGIVWGIREVICRKNWDRLLIQLAGMICFLGWLASAPLIRYGKAWLLVGMFLPIGSVMEYCSRKFEDRNINLYERLLKFGTVFLILLMCFPNILSLFHVHNIITQEDYVYQKCEKTK